MKDNKVIKDNGKRKQNDERKILLRHVPDDILEMIVEEQAAIKIKRGIFVYSFADTIFKILRDYKRCKQENKFQP